jgi:hypothetical protein
MPLGRTRNSVSKQRPLFGAARNRFAAFPQLSGQKDVPDGLSDDFSTDVFAEKTPATRTGLGNMRRHLFTVVAITVILAGCASVQQRAEELRSKLPCCATLPEIPYRPADLRPEHIFELSDTSPVFNFREGKSYFHAISIQPSAASRNVKVRIFQQGSQGFEPMKNSLVLCPTVVFLDEEKKPFASVDLPISKAKPTSFLGPSITEARVWHSSMDVPAAAAHIIFYTKPTLFGRPNSVAVYRFTQVVEFFSVPCGPTGSVELTSQ